MGVRRGADGDGMCTLRAELRSRRKLGSAVRAGPGERRGAILAELRPRRVLMLAPGTLHRVAPASRAGGSSMVAPSVATEISWVKRRQRPNMVSTVSVSGLGEAV